MKNQRKIQIGVIGSMADLSYSPKIEKWAEEVGFWIAKKGGVLLFGAEKDYDSLSAAAARGAKKAGGVTLGVTYNQGMDVFDNTADVVIASGLDRGGGREFPFILSCDAVISLSGGSGTLTEIAIAYQADIPIVALQESGGWSQKLAGTYLDSRKRIRIQRSKTPREAVQLAIRSAERKISFEKRDILFSCCTHGNEVIGYKALTTLEREGRLSPSDWMVGNPRALKTGQRYVDTDLNRIFPGKKNSLLYEERRASEMLQLAKKFRFVVDIHGTDAETGIFVIISRPSMQNLLLASLLDIPRIVFWPSISPNRNIPFNAAVPIGIEIECGPQKDPLIQKNLENTLKKFLRDFSRLSFSDISERLSQKEMYWVDGKLPALKKKTSWKEFQRVRSKGKIFYPLLLNRYKDTLCYTMKRISTQEIFSDHHTP